jgi:crotonobetainyl-CoA:carnitine CoA-transferase CaiB-like acyl-CoA transferase
VSVLKGVRVLEMGTFITGPAAGMLLADLGADVIKIEQPETGDPFRAFQGGLYSPQFQSYNRSKRSIALDMTEAADIAAFDALVIDADVFIQNFRPGAAEHLHIDSQRLQSINPSLVYCAVTGFGPSGPWRDRPAFDTVAQAASGILRLLLNPASPRVVGPAIADAITGFYAALGILGALFERTATGIGKTVEVSMYEAMCHFNIDDFTHYFSANKILDAFSRPRVSQSYVFECADGKWLALHMSSPPKFWEGLAAAVGQPGMLKNPMFSDRASRIASHDKIIEYLAALFVAHPLSEWSKILLENDVPHAQVSSPDEIVESEQARHLGLVIEADHPEGGRFRSIRSPLSFNGVRQSKITAPPVLDADGPALRATPSMR